MNVPGENVAQRFAEEREFGFNAASELVAIQQVRALRSMPEVFGGGRAPDGDDLIILLRRLKPHEIVARQRLSHVGTGCAFVANRASIAPSGEVCSQSRSCDHFRKARALTEYFGAGFCGWNDGIRWLVL